MVVIVGRTDDTPLPTVVTAYVILVTPGAKATTAIRLILPTFTERVGLVSNEKLTIPTILPGTATPPAAVTTVTETKTATSLSNRLSVCRKSTDPSKCYARVRNASGASADTSSCGGCSSKLA